MTACRHDPPCKGRCYDKPPHEILADDLEHAARLIRDHGPRAMAITRDWEPGPKSPALQPSSGIRYEACEDPGCVDLVECFNPACEACPNPTSTDPDELRHMHGDVRHSHIVPGDATGETSAATAASGAGHRPTDLHQELRTAERNVARFARTITAIIKAAVPNARDEVPPIREETREEIARGGWCVSCYRLDRRCEPIATRVDSRSGNTVALYSEFCRWCGDFRGEWAHVLGANGLPPLEIVRLHHTPGRRVTLRKVIDTLAEYAEKNNRPVPVPDNKRTAGQSKKRRPTLEYEHAGDDR